jgi:hypothetical protein
MTQVLVPVFLLGKMVMPGHGANTPGALLLVGLLVYLGLCRVAGVVNHATNCRLRARQPCRWRSASQAAEYFEGVTRILFRTAVLTGIAVLAVWRPFREQLLAGALSRAILGGLVLTLTLMFVVITFFVLESRLHRNETLRGPYAASDGRSVR